MTEARNIHKPAPLWRRFAAMIYDSVVIFAIWMLVGFAVLSAFGINGAVTAEGETVVLDPLYRWTLFGAMLLSAYLFFAWFWTHSGQTIGMQAWKIKVQNENGTAINYKQALIRVLLGGLSIMFFGAGHFWMLFNKKRYTLHDHASKSEVVKLP